MSQEYVANVFEPDLNIEASLNRMEGNFKALKSTNSGPNEPDYMPTAGLWYQTESNEGLKLSVNNSVVAVVLMSDSSHKVWVGKNESSAGWVIDGSIYDCLISIKGGSYGVVGGVTTGSWNFFSHSHTPGSYSVNHVHTVTSSVSNVGPTELNATGRFFTGTPSGNPAVTGTSGPNSSASTWRPSALVGTVQYPQTII